MCLDYSSRGIANGRCLLLCSGSKMIWDKHLLDANYSSTWKSIEVVLLQKFHPDIKILWKSYVPDKILTQLQNTQLANSLKSWYFF